MQRRYRIRSRSEFQQIYQEGRSFANRAAVLYVLGGREGGPRMGFAAGRKLGSAVLRNRVRRRIREAVRLAWPWVRGTALMILIGRAAAENMPFGELQQKIAELLHRAGVLDPGAPFGPAAGRAQKGPPGR